MTNETQTAPQPNINLDNSYGRLPSKFFQKTNPVPVKAPRLVKFNQKLADDLNIDLSSFNKAELAQYFSGNLLFENSNPLSMAYAGHQFGNFVPQLGDGRANLLGEIVKDDKHFDIQLKGSGQTQYSRNGDGRSALGPVIREYVISEAMHALDIPTTRSLAMVTTGEKVLRQTGYIPGGILTRVAASHIRVGTFEYFTSLQDDEALKELTDYAIKRHYPELSSTEAPYKNFFQKVCESHALLVPKWMQVGFIHGVMNTDNTTISGETIDYGPCAFMENYNPNTVFSSIDMHGRYKFANQGAIAAWNLSSLGNSLLPLLADDKEEAQLIVRECIDQFQKSFLGNWQEGMNKKLGLSRVEDDDLELLKAYLELMAAQEADFTLSFRYLSDCVSSGKMSKRLMDQFKEYEGLENWLTLWQQRIQNEKNTTSEIETLMNKTNPAFIPRNHLVERAINLAEKEDDFSETHKLIDVLSAPFTERTDLSEYMQPAKPEERVLHTFCGT